MKKTDMDPVLTVTDGTIRIIRFNRPERLNAVNEALYEETIQALQKADADGTIRAVILTGQGRAFCVGADLKAHGSAKRSPEQQRQYVDLGQRVCYQIQTMATPVIAAVAGYALGAGAEMAISADFLLMAEDAQMGFPEISIGTFVGGGVTSRLPRLVGLRRATELLVLGERFTGVQAAQWGLIHAAVPGDQLMQSAKELATSLASKAPLAMARMKAALFRDDDIETAFASEPEQLLALMQTADWAEGIAAFAEKRQPVFQGK